MRKLLNITIIAISIWSASVGYVLLVDANATTGTHDDAALRIGSPEYRQALKEKHHSLKVFREDVANAHRLPRAMQKTVDELIPVMDEEGRKVWYISSGGNPYVTYFNPELLDVDEHDMYLVHPVSQSSSYHISWLQYDAAALCVKADMVKCYLSEAM